jgi:hypothetical protein
MDETFTHDTEELWDAGFEGGRYIVVGRIWPFTWAFQRPPAFTKRFWHSVYELAIRDWRIPLEPLRLGQMCVVEAELRIRYQPSARYAREHLEFLPELNAQVEASLQALLKDIAEQEIRRMESDSGWLEDGCAAIEQSVAGIVNEVLILRGLHCRSRCHIEPRFAAVDAVDLDALPPWTRHQAVYEDYLRRRRAAKERILAEQTEEEAAARRLLMEREALLLALARQEDGQRQARQAHEMANLQAELAAEEMRLKEQLASETRKREEEYEHQTQLRQKQAEADSQAREAALAKHHADMAAEAAQQSGQIESETQREEARLRHEAELRQKRAEAELQAMESDLAAQRAELAAEAAQQTEWQSHALRQREDQLIHEGWLRQMQAEAEIKAQETELETRRIAEEALRGKQHEAEARQREAQLRHEARLRQLQAAADLQAKEAELERLRAEMAKVEAQLAQQREYEARQHQEQLRHSAQLRQWQTEQELEEKALRTPELAELEAFLDREIGVLAMERQRLRLEEEIREARLSRTRDFIGKTRRRAPTEPAAEEPPAP